MGERIDGMLTAYRRFVADERGATAIEYGLIVAVLSLAIVTGVGAAGDGLRFLWSDNNSRLVQGLQ
jgi:pilus assembly protein Flp/PilA